ncbi:TetR/AcrR family transcriptional regulator [uncultured Eubacterium sp.]|uniref:TetR/AcrR family transcriptional regulator n=1 Tax=uncultured Eubacterium sp. TaxID=165185 RepID=UPI0025F549F9|nr:TetR/AcrR family transcriptional regulator [uncultured Eubacterium sp.]
MDHRAERMKSLIIQTFFDCLEKEDFSQITVGQIAKQALINRSTFYRYFSDKYDLRDEIVDEIVRDFAEHMEVDFLHMDIQDEVHTRSLQDGLSRLSTQKSRLEILWNQNLLGRNVFDEMMNAGARKVEAEILNHPTISPEKKQLADWYAKLLVNNFLVTVRWWFSHSDTVSASQITIMMERHMLYGTIPTLKESR